MCVRALLIAIERGDPTAGLRAALALFAVLCTKAFVENQFFYRVTNMATRTRASLQSAIYTKSLHLPESAAAVPPVTLMQVDTGKVEGLAYSAHTLWDGIFQVVGYSFLLVRYLGVAGLAGLVLLLGLLPINALLQRSLSVANKATLKASGERVARTGEILGGIRAIRQTGWEAVFEGQVRELRERELVAMRARNYLGACIISIFSALPPFMTTVVLLAYAAVGPGASAGGVVFAPSTVFTALALLNQIRFPLLFYPNALEALSEGRAALQRIAAFLALEETPPRAGAARGAGLGSEGTSSPVQLSVPAGRYALSPGGGPTLVLPEPVEIQKGELVAVVGAVGSGKSSLLRALTGELPHAGLAAPPGRVAYCAQKPWVPTGSLVDIVTGGIEFCEQLFKHACKAAVVDFVRPEDEISAATLSGGQQARVALARAIYHAQVQKMPHGEPALAAVLDDVTAALDPETSAVVAQRCLFESLGQQTRVIVTSDTGALLRRCDRVIVMERAGDELRVKAAAPYCDLVHAGALAPSIWCGLEHDESDSEVEPGGSHSHEEVEASSDEGVSITVAEERAQGSVPAHLYRRYFRSGKSPIMLTVTAMSVVATYVATVAQQWFIGLWTADTALMRGLPFYLAGVSLLGVLSAMLVFLRTLLIAAFARRAGRVIHQELCQSVLVRATTRYFDANPIGRVLQRFAKDLEQVDGAMPNALRSAITCACSLAGAMLTVVVASPPFLVLLVPLSWVYFRALLHYLPVARDLKRLEALARSPVYTEQVAAAEGVATIRQLDLGTTMRARALNAIDGNTAVTYAVKGVDRWFSLRMELLGNVVVLVTALLGLAATAGGGAGSSWAAARSAVAVTQVLSVVGLLNWTVRTIADTETNFSSMQRVVFTIDKTEREAPHTLPRDKDLAMSGWPARGGILFRGVSLRYRDDLPWALRGVDLEVPPGHRVAVVGGTGSGKSTLLRALLRTVEIGSGNGVVLLDGVDIMEVGLEKLRTVVTAIPQENFVLTGTVRANVDPSGLHSDDEILAALRAASLGHWHLDQKLDPGRGISPGERQLLGVARALVRRSKVVALDEVTSRVDEATDRQVQEALHALPAGTTLLVISHRLQTLDDYDTVIVMESGRVAEVGSPAKLRASPGSIFSRLLDAENSSRAPQPVVVA